MDVAVFVNTSDGFQDCWRPFFELFSRFGGMLRDWPIYLNTERTTFAWPGLNMIATAVWPQTELKRPMWSECLLRGLNAVPQRYVLYLQEDYFLRNPVDDSVISQALDVLDSDKEAGVVYLVNEIGPTFSKYLPYTDHFVEIARPVRYLVCTQAAIWRKTFLTSLVRPWENGWMFEKFASGRARRCVQKFLTTDRAAVSVPAMDYVFTGIIKGRWKTECVPFFEKVGIPVDFSERGFYSESGRVKSRSEMLHKLLADPAGALYSFLSLITA